MKAKKDVFKAIDLSLIDRPAESSRIEIDDAAVEELARNIRARGLMHPITLNQQGERYEIIAGDRRYLAHRHLGLTKIMSKVIEVDQREVLLLRGTENLHRANLSPLEEGRTYKGLIENVGMTVEDIAQETGRSAGVIKRRLDVVRMPESFQRALHKRLISLTVAEELWNCPNEGHREYLLEMASEHGVTKDVARMWVADYKRSLRSTECAGEGGELSAGVYESDPVYRPCDLCKEAVEISKAKDLRVCPGCFGELLKVIKGE